MKSLPIICLIPACLMFQGCATPVPVLPSVESTKDDTSNLVVLIYGLEEDEGQISMTCRTDGPEWPTGEGAEYVRVIPVAGHDGMIEIAIDDVPCGIYAISLFHDVNADNDMNRSAIGLPLEPWGMSNNAIGMLSAPTFEQASFVVNGPTTLIELDLRRGITLQPRAPVL